MYRRHLQDSNMSNESSEQFSEQGLFLQRLANYPVVSTTIGHVTELYGRTKESSPLVKSTLESAEKSVLAAANSAKPVIEKFHDQSKYYNFLNSFIITEQEKM